MKITIKQLRSIIQQEGKKIVRLKTLIVQKENSCPLETRDLAENTKNRNVAIKAEHIQYGPINLSDENYWKRLSQHWNTSVDVVKKSLCGNCAAFDISPRMNQCMPGDIQDRNGRLGYCWMHKFKCHSARSCYTWAAGGPITEDRISYSWQRKSG